MKYQDKLDLFLEALKQNREENKNELRRIVSEARLSGVTKKDIQKLVDEYYSGK